jgi:hypothetical protein
MLKGTGCLISNFRFFPAARGFKMPQRWAGQFLGADADHAVHRSRLWKSVQRTITVCPSRESGGIVLNGRWLQLRWAWVQVTHMPPLG